ncbi:MAG: trimethylamine methyltransferase family protein, partial [Firmicutes bacterium]|nr:trimethylamine methyltransferase family protein [Bacillota bacterium]
VGPGGHFLDHPHTVEHVRNEFYFPKLSDRQQRSVWEEAGSKDTFTRAHEEARRILEKHEPLGFSEDMEKHLREKYSGIK